MGRFTHTPVLMVFPESYRNLPARFYVLTLIPSLEMHFYVKNIETTYIGVVGLRSVTEVQLTNTEAKLNHRSKNIVCKRKVGLETQ